MKRLELEARARAIEHEARVRAERKYVFASMRTLQKEEYLKSKEELREATIKLKEVRTKTKRVRESSCGC